MKPGSKMEQELKAEIAPTPNTIAELSEYIRSLEERHHDYEMRVLAMSLAATATFNYVSRKLGATTRQASIADLDIVRRIRNIEGPFLLLLGEDMLYPARDLLGQLDDAMDGWSDWAAEQAEKKMQQHEQKDMHPEVWAHWEKLVARKSTT